MNEGRCLICGSNEGTIIFNVSDFPVFLGVYNSVTLSEKKYPAILRYCNKCGFVQQQYSTELNKFLNGVYSLDGFISTPPGYSSWGDARAQDIIKFIDENIESPRSILEIGCHSGYLLSNLQRRYGCKALGVEPGNIKNSPENIAIINDFFPTEKLANAKFDLIVCQAVLEHVFDPLNFLRSIRKHLTDKGILLISVPDCTKNFSDGDIGLFLHEHISHFTVNTIQFALAMAGLECVNISNDRGSLMATATLGKPNIFINELDESPIDYEKKINEKIKFLLGEVTTENKVGLYGACALAHNLLQITKTFEKVILYDGDEYKHGKYLLGVTTPIQKWVQIVSDPISKVIIIPYAFQEEIYTFLVSKKHKKEIVRLY
jgi:2-polyprenyl-3-methyl-5-hydroxy-6-metoxy-1,4-benzoquinol methylase